MRWLRNLLRLDTQQPAVRVQVPDEDDPPERKLLKRFATGVAGESFQNPDGVSRQALIRLCEEGDPVRLVREPGNERDENAIQVISRLGVIGYIKSDVAERLARDIDRGRVAKADILSIRLIEEVELFGVVIEVSVYEVG